MKRSIIIPFYNEEECITEVLDELIKTCPNAEIVAVNDGSSDQTGELLNGFAGVKSIHFPINLGQSAAFYHGLHAASGDICIMMDGDGQNDPADIDTLVSKLTPQSMVCGVRKNRQDTWARKAASKIANGIRSSVLDDGASDTGCSLKALHREDVKFMIPFNGLHRFMPALMKGAGLEIIEVPVNHRPRTKGVSKYTVGGRALRGLYDLFGVAWLLSRKIRWQHNPYSDV
ncbi:MAG: glycosyltransferase family 2 protein [Verrucomicrobiota bacterium]